MLNKLFEIVDRVKNEHEKFLLNLEEPMHIPKEKVIRWHPQFDVESCPPVEQSELPKPPVIEKASSAQEVLGTYQQFYNNNLGDPEILNVCKNESSYSIKK